MKFIPGTSKIQKGGSCGRTHSIKKVNAWMYYSDLFFFSSERKKADQRSRVRSMELEFEQARAHGCVISIRRIA